MQIALLADIHSNLHALRAVWEDLSQEKPDAVYNLGDLVGYGAFPNEVIEFVRNERIESIMGNYDEAVAYRLHESGALLRRDEAGSDRLALNWTQETMTEESRIYLQSLPLQRRATLHGKRFLFVHGSPRRMNDYLYEGLSAATLDSVIRLADCDVLCVGHTHVPMRKRHRRTWLVNPGSVGLPQAGDTDASYALLTLGLRPRITIRKVSYDNQAALQAIKAAGLPETLGLQMTLGRSDDSHARMKKERIQNDGAR